MGETSAPGERERSRLLSGQFPRCCCSALRRCVTRAAPSKLAGHPPLLPTASPPAAASHVAAGLSFADFLERMKDPAAADLVRNIKR